MAIARRYPMPQKVRSWLAVGLALGATVVVVSFVAATCAWRSPTTRHSAARAVRPPIASTAARDRERGGALRDRGLATAAVGDPAAQRAATAADLPTTQNALGESGPSAQRAGRGSPLDVPWALPGQCPSGRADGRTEARAAYLRTFVPIAAWHTTLFFHPTVPREAATAVALSVQKIHDFATHQIGLPSEPPPIYVYPSVDPLREHSCAAASAVAYYDGSIHLAIIELGSDRELETSLRHEYAHHVLVSNGVGKPIWLQEGTAMAFAGDKPHDSYRIWREHRVDLSAMVDSFPKLGPPETAEVFNAQAWEMTEFLQRLCLARPDCNPAELVHALLNESATPATLFAWATAERGSDMFETTPLRFWSDYEERGNFSPEELATLLGRVNPRGAP